MSYAGDITPQQAWDLLNDDPEAVREPTQHHGMREREPDPVDAEQRDGDAADARLWPGERDPEDDRQCEHGEEHNHGE